MNYRYDLGPEEIREVTGQFLRDHPHASDDKYVCYATDDAESPISNVARTVETIVFDDAFGNDGNKMVQEYGNHETASTFFLSIDRVNVQPSGVLRTIRNSPAGFKTLTDLEKEERFDVTADGIMTDHHIDDPNECWDIGTVAVLPQYRKGGPATQLYRAMYQRAIASDIEHFVSIIDRKPYRKMRHLLGIPFVPIKGTSPFPYLGSKKSIPVYGDVPEFYGKMDRHRFTPGGFIARKARGRLVYGSADSGINSSVTEVN